MQHHKNQGQTLIEAVVAVGLMALLTTGLLISSTYAIRVGSEGRTRSLAAKYAQEGLERVRTLRDNGWTVFQNTYGPSASPTIWCLPKDGVWVSGACTSDDVIDSVYTRSVEFTWDSGNSRMDVTVTVTWQDAKGPRDTQVRSYFTQWR